MRGLASILDLVGPFLRGGFAPDPDAVGPMRGRGPFATPSRGRLASTLCLEPRASGHWRLMRTVRRDDGLVATLHADGERPAALLGAIEAVRPDSQFVDAEGWTMAVSGRVSDDGGEPIPVGAEARIGASLELEATTFETSGARARLEVRACVDDPPRLPADVFAVLGWDWSFLRPDDRGWNASVRLRGHGAPRARAALARIEAAAAHLARMVDERPRRSRDRSRPAR